MWRRTVDELASVGQQHAKKHAVPAPRFLPSSLLPLNDARVIVDIVDFGSCQAKKVTRPSVAGFDGRFWAKLVLGPSPAKTVK